MSCWMQPVVLDFSLFQFLNIGSKNSKHSGEKWNTSSLVSIHAWPNGFLISPAHHVLGKTEIAWAEKENLALNLDLTLLTPTLTYYLTFLNLIFFSSQIRYHIYLARSLWQLNEIMHETQLAQYSTHNTCIHKCSYLHNLYLYPHVLFFSIHHFID